MNYKELFAKIKSDGYREVVSHLNENTVHKPEGIDEMLLAVATTCYSTGIRKDYKTLLSKIGGEPVKQALKRVSKRDYNAGTGEKNLLADLLELEKIEGFNAPVFSKYVGLVAWNLKAAGNYFTEHGTDEEISYFLLNELYVNSDPQNIQLTLGHKISPRLAQLIWNAVPKLAPFITNLTCVTDGKVDPGFDVMDMPKLEYLTIEADTDKFPVFVLGVPSLKELIITNKANKVPSGISKLVNLEKLSLYMPITEIPEEIFTLKNLKSLSFGNTQITVISEAIGQLENLTYFGLYNNPGLKALPESVFTLPNLSDYYKEDFKAIFSPVNEYQKLYNEMGYYIRDFDTIPEVKELLEKYKLGEEPNFFPELFMAACKCYYDDEHGRSLGTLFNEVGKHSPEKLKGVNIALKSFRYIDETTTSDDYDKMRKKLVPYEWFDVEKFIALCQIMVADVYEKYPFAKW
jgi:hypothetical protein